MFVSESGRSETMSLGTATGNFGFVSYDTDDAGEIVEMRQHFNFRLSDKIGTARNANICLTDSGTVPGRAGPKGRWTSCEPEECLRSVSMNIRAIITSTALQRPTCRQRAAWTTSLLAEPGRHR